MKILYLHQYFTTPSMAGGTRSYEMARRLVAAGHEVHVLTSIRNGSKNRRSWHTDVIEGIIVHSVPVPYSNSMSVAARLWAFAKFALLAGPRAVKLRGDLVFGTSTPLTIALPAITASKLLRVPLVFEVRDLWPAVPIAMGYLRNPVVRWLASRLERAAYFNSRYVVALSEGMKKGVVQTGFPSDRVSVIPNACDFESLSVPDKIGRALRKRIDWLGDRPLVVYCGTMGAVNGLEYMVRLAAAVSRLDDEIRFAIIGRGKQEVFLRHLAEELGVLDRNLFFIGPVPKVELSEWLSAASIATSFVIDKPILWENSANKFFDALAAGRPIAINHGGWQADLIRETGCGLLLHHSNPEDAAASVVGAVRDQQWLTTAGAAAERTGRARFDRDMLAMRLRNLLESAVAG